MLRTAVILFALLSALGAATWCSSRCGRVQVSLWFVGYTNASYGPHVGVVQISNASPFAVVRGRSPKVMTDSASGLIEHSPAPIGWNLLEPGECERVMTEPLTNNTMWWRMTVVCQREGHEDYGVTRESRVRRAMRWLQDHRISVPAPSPNPQPQFSSDWIEP
jgi:hypothetical protein